MSVGGYLSCDLNNWRLNPHELREWEKRDIIARVLEVAVLVTMSTHVYSFGSKLFIQRSGGPIGMRSTASLGNVVMKYFDKAWKSILMIFFFLN